MQELLLIFVVIFLVKIISVNTGGGGLVSIPFLIFLGFPPSTAIATHRVGTLPAGFTSLWKFHVHKQVKWRLGMTMIIPATIGSFLGAWSVVRFSDDVLQTVIAVIILISAPLLFVKKDFGLQETQVSKERLILGHVLALGGGYLAGLFAATGVWFALLYVFMGLTFLQSAATRKITGNVMALASSAVFISAGLVNWQAAIVMAVASALGGWIGAELGMKAGNIWIKRVFALVVIASAVKLLVG